MPQPKDKDWLNGYKNKMPIYVIYKKHTSKQGTHARVQPQWIQDDSKGRLIGKEKLIYIEI